MDKPVNKPVNIFVIYIQSSSLDHEIMRKAPRTTRFFSFLHTRFGELPVFSPSYMRNSENHPFFLLPACATQRITRFFFLSASAIRRITRFFLLPAHIIQRITRLFFLPAGAIRRITHFFLLPAHTIQRITRLFFLPAGAIRRIVRFSSFLHA